MLERIIISIIAYACPCNCNFAKKLCYAQDSQISVGNVGNVGNMDV